MTAAPIRLSLASLSRVSRRVQTPRYERRRLSTGIVHIGLGAFFRAHGAVYTDDVLDCGAALNWGVTGVSLRQPDQRDRLQPQDGLYSLICRGSEAPTARIVGCVLDVLVAPETPEHVLSRLSDAATAIVSLTVTEKGYGHDPATGLLNVELADVAHDLAATTAARPRTAIGFLVAALARRRTAGLPPFTVLCCDNLAHNGRLLRGLVLAHAAARDDSLAAWIERHGAFPSTMVDRIVPATTEADIADAALLCGLIDAAPVVHEPFRQWVIEDAFVDGRRPPWQNAGAELVSDVAPHEAMKLRLLNAAHSALAYLGYLAGHETIADCMADPVVAAYVAALWREELVAVVEAPAGVDVGAYTQALGARFANPAVRHRTWQIAMDGSQKLPQRLLASARVRLARGLTMPRLAHAVAAWAIYVSGRDLGGRPIDVRDPLAAELTARLARAAADSVGQIDALLAVDAIFGRDLAAAGAFRSAVIEAHQRLLSRGVRGALADLA